MASATSMPIPNAMAQTFSLANTVPQSPEQNSEHWTTTVSDTRQCASRSKGDVCVITGPVFDANGRPRNPGRFNELLLGEHKFAQSATPR